MATTLKDIADAVGLSQVSVSKALRGTGRIAPATRFRVLEVAREMRYRPNSLARSMRNGRTGNVGFIYTREETPRSIPLEFLGGIVSTLNERSYNLVVGEVPNRTLAQPGEVSGLLREWTADGLLIHHHLQLPDQVAELVEENHIPAVWINSRQPVNCVYFDDFDGARRAVLHFAELGHTRIGYFDPSHGINTLAAPVHDSVTDRLEGYHKGIEEAGLKPAVMMEPEEVPYTRRFAFARAALSSRRRPTACLCYGDIYPLLFATASLNLAIPGDLSVLVFAPSPMLTFDQRIGAMCIDQREIAIQATRALLERVTSADPDSPRDPIRIPLHLDPGNSTAPPPKR